MIPTRSRAVRFLVITALVAGLVLVLSPQWLPAVGRVLVKAEAPTRADVALVLAGDYFGNRILEGGRLVREGYVPQVLVSGPEGFYGVPECDLAVAFAVKKGLPEQWFVRLPSKARSTVEEALITLPEIRRRGARRVLVVTSNYHTARAGRIFRSLAPDLEIHMVAAPDEFFRPDDWWRNRQARKTVFIEWSKTVAGFFNL